MTNLKGYKTPSRSKLVYPHYSITLGTTLLLLMLMPKIGLIGIGTDVLTHLMIVLISGGQLVLIAL
ncbi:uncharacterized protein PGTG_21204 [Puccinia graminis f. sp. tritici CRL 75-36-700-3]|uniref:Uncharacterized protein n=1 Tax=Puccinia graminis f. sp. tritici (strain CRL 75-36-700-3 / race SCCL) TaxID=418459 RepID=H6QQM0_PUCGT|nr:uncharacterized protein PGTG_21204 [Puccinia graminis f. sp. tritici CRL 75-36-700-3]EHS62738.1 hypothetical protein PGTG_21204 [Puccinia graminis f. sp. tritici CRL 75-36-700-3]